MEKIYLFPSSLYYFCLLLTLASVSYFVQSFHLQQKTQFTNPNNALCKYAAYECITSADHG